jgi:hypothetical protein
MNNSNTLIQKLDELDTVESVIEPVRFQVAIVSCRDAEKVGIGDARARICANGLNATCDWDWYTPPSTLGTCILPAQ